MGRITSDKCSNNIQNSCLNKLKVHRASLEELEAGKFDLLVRLSRPHALSCSSRALLSFKGRDAQ